MDSQTIEAQVQYKNPKTITVKTADFHINFMSWSFCHSSGYELVSMFPTLRSFKIVLAF